MTDFTGYATHTVIVITDLDILMDFHEKVWGVLLGPTIAMTKTTYKPPTLVKFLR